MDNAEEELRMKLEKLSKEVYDPSLEAREQEIWARMLGIRDIAQRLKAEMEKIQPKGKEDEPVLDEATIKAAKQASLFLYRGCQYTNELYRHSKHMTHSSVIYKKSYRWSSKNLMIGKGFQREATKNLRDEDSITSFTKSY